MISRDLAAQVVVEYRTAAVVLSPSYDGATPHAPTSGLHVSFDGHTCVDGVALP